MSIKIRDPHDAWLEPDEEPMRFCPSCAHESPEDEPWYHWEQEIVCENCMNRFMDLIKAESLLEESE